MNIEIIKINDTDKNQNSQNVNAINMHNMQMMNTEITGQYVRGAESTGNDAADQTVQDALNVSNNMPVQDTEKYIIKSVSDIEKDTFADFWTYESIIDSLSYDYNYVIVGVDSSCIVTGYILYNMVGGDTELLRIAVRDMYRGNGIAKSLMNEYLSRVDKSCENAFLEVRSGNTPARNLYEKYGYKAINTRKNYYANPTEDGVIYLATLSVDEN